MLLAGTVCKCTALRPSCAQLRTKPRSPGRFSPLQSQNLPALQFPATPILSRPRPALALCAAAAVSRAAVVLERARRGAFPDRRRERRRPPPQSAEGVIKSYARIEEGADVKTLLLWCVLLVLCWPVAILALVLWPLIWLMSLPFRFHLVVCSFYRRHRRMSIRHQKVLLS